ncbi:MAG: efflux RND transporter periplasmic adaptor subunit [Myxococcota bacterium]
MNTTTPKPSLAGWLALSIAALAVSACEKEVEPQPEVIRPVQFFTVGTATSAEAPTRSFTGVSQSANSSRLSFKVTGNIDKLNVKVGDTVKRGALIAEVDDSDFKLKVEEARAALAQVNAEARSAKANYERTRSLYESQTASKADLDAARTQYESAQAQVRSTSKSVQQAQIQVGYTKLKAPDDGAIASVDVRINENISPGQPIVTLATGDRLEVQVGVPEQLITTIKEGDKVEVAFDALADTSFKATVTKVSVTAAQQSTFPVTVTLDAPSDKIRAGMATTVTFSFDLKNLPTPKQTGPKLPSVAVLEDQKGRYVWVVEKVNPDTKQGTIARRDVTIGPLSGNGFPVQKGLAEGDVVVTAGVNTVIAGQEVKLLPEHKQKPEVNP